MTVVATSTAASVDISGKGAGTLTITVECNEDSSLTATKTYTKYGVVLGDDWDVDGDIISVDVTTNGTITDQTVSASYLADGDSPGEESDISSLVTREIGKISIDLTGVTGAGLVRLAVGITEDMSAMASKSYTKTV